MFIAGGGEIASKEGTTQGDPLAMPWYSINTERLIYWLKSVKSLLEKIKQVWLADDAAAGGLLKDLFDWFQLLTERGGPLGYFVNGSKSWLIVKKEEDIVRAREIFGYQFNITTEGQRHLGASLGSPAFKREYCTEKVNSWSKQL